MSTHNSPAGFYSGLLVSLYHDLVAAKVSQRETRRDVLEIERRLAEEGLGFITKTLPRLGKAIDRSLSQGTKLTIPNFKKKKGTELPAFCWTLFSSVFHVDGFPICNRKSECRDDIRGVAPRDSQVPPDESQALAVRALRMLCFCFYKLELPYETEQEDKVIADFIQADGEVPDLYDHLGNEDKMVMHTAARLVRRVVNMYDPFSGIPRHGPGAVATGEIQSEKHKFTRYYERLAQQFPYDKWFYCNNDHLCDSFDELQGLEVHETGTAKVVLVPKDSRGPRLISCEPLEYQWIQQALCSVLVTGIEQHPMTSGRVNFTRQDVNRDLALRSSLTGEYVTLDMKEASDRVGLALVKELFPSRWYDALYACRTPATKLPDGRVVQMKKFAPMGSAVCFPVESLVFWALCVATLRVKHKLPLRKAVSSVYVYGDDLICRSEYHGSVVSTLPMFGLKLNEDKCCVTGFFRESCGMDAFAGHPVIPVRCRTPWSQRPKPAVLASYTAQSNELWAQGMWRSSGYIFDHLQKIWGKSIPVVSDKNIGCIAFVRPGWSSGSLNRAQWRFNKSLQRHEVRGFRLRSEEISTQTFGFPLLLRVLAKMERNDSIESRDGSHEPLRSMTNSSIYPIAHRNKLCRAWTAASR